MYIRVTENGIKKVHSLKSLGLNVSFPKNPTDEILSEFNIFRVKQTVPPTPSTFQRVVENEIVEIDGVWQTSYSLVDMDEEEIEQVKLSLIENARQSRAEAYREEADPLFFKWQRGEVTEQEWLDKIEEIKQRYPYQQ